MSNIKIAVACHKPSELPKNSLFMPVQVGSALAKNKMPNMKHDDTGDNISEKNPSYCELTAQYWAWKNVDADYYGLCHYRRFICFRSDVKATRNERKQLIASVIDEENKQRFGLEDEEEMRRIIEENDVVVGLEQKVSDLYTPYGRKNTAYEHWKALDRALIMTEDLDTMLDILESVDSEVGKDTREYLNSNEFLGFNCFVMRKDLFNRMCEIEFKTLELLEKKVNLNGYNSQIARIYGFMGEIIFSGFVYHLRKNGQYKIKNLPLVYFNHTDPINISLSLEPKKDHIPILFNFGDCNPIRTGVTLRSFIDTMNKTTKYDVILLANLNDDMKDIFNAMVCEHKNISLRFIDTSLVRDILDDRYNIKSEMISPSIANDSVSPSLMLFIPLLLHEYNKMIVVNENNIFCRPIDEIWEEYKDNSSMVCAPKDLYSIARINGIYYKYDTVNEELLNNIKNISNYFSTNVLCLNFNKYRKTIEINEIKNIIAKIKSCDRNLIFNLLCKEDVTLINQKWGTLYDSNYDYIAKLPFIPLDDMKNLQNARKEPGVICFMQNDPWLDLGQNLNKTYQLFWEIAKKTAFYELYIKRGMDLSIHFSKNGGEFEDMVLKKIPNNSKARDIIRKIFPYGSRRNKVIKDIIRKFSD